MKNIRFLCFSLLLFVAAGCRDSGHVDRAKEQVGKMAERATNALARIEAGDLSDFDSFRGQLRTIKSSLATNDFSKAKECADQIDKLLQTKIVAQSIEFLRIESTEGTEKARAAITDYMAENNLGEAETKALRQVLNYFEEMDKMERIDLVSGIIYIALEREMGHGAGVPTAFARVLMQELFIGEGATNLPSLQPQ